jgi:hypothetical protein
MVNEVNKIISEISKSRSLDDKLEHLKTTDPLLRLIFQSITDETTALKNCFKERCSHLV